MDSWIHSSGFLYLNVGAMDLSLSASFASKQYMISMRVSLCFCFCSMKVSKIFLKLRSRMLNANFENSSAIFIIEGDFR